MLCRLALFGVREAGCFRDGVVGSPFNYVWLFTGAVVGCMYITLHLH